MIEYYESAEINGDCETFSLRATSTVRSRTNVRSVQRKTISLSPVVKIHVYGLDVRFFEFRMVDDFFRFLLERVVYTRHRLLWSHRAVGPYPGKCIERKQICYYPSTPMLQEWQRVMGLQNDYGGVDKLSTPPPLTHNRALFTEQLCAYDENATCTVFILSVTDNHDATTTVCLRYIRKESSASRFIEVKNRIIKQIFSQIRFLLRKIVSCTYILRVQ